MKLGIPYSNVIGEGAGATIHVGDDVITSYDAKGLDAATQAPVFNAGLKAVLDKAGYPAKADEAQINKTMVILLIGLLVIFAAMTYGPIAAMLVELFPARIRYSSLSLPYHIGNGWVGGFMPPVAFAIIAATGSMYDGLWYPIIVSAICFLVGVIFLPETKDRTIHHEAN